LAKDDARLPILQEIRGSVALAHAVGSCSCSPPVHPHLVPMSLPRENPKLFQR